MVTSIKSKTLLLISLTTLLFSCKNDRFDIFNGSLLNNGALAKVTTMTPTNISASGATLGGELVGSGDSYVKTYGVCYSKNPNPTIGLNSKTNSRANNSIFTEDITNLSGNTRYFVRAYVTNNIGTSYGEEFDFLTLPVKPAVATSNATEITSTSAKIGGSIISDGGSPVTETGIYWGLSNIPATTGTKVVVGNGVGGFSTTISNLNPATRYYFTAYAINEEGNTYGGEGSFTTLGIPIITTAPISNTPENSVLCGGEIISDGGYPITARGICWSINPIPTADLVTKTIDGLGSGKFTSRIDGLNSYTTYYVRAYATNSIGTGYGSVVNITLQGSIIVTDIDGNQYNTIAIGTQTWMKENLKTTKFRNGDPITYIENDISWLSQDEQAYCWYGNEINNKPIFGALYNHYAVADNRQLCPDGWHVPSDDEWTVLENYLGGVEIAGVKLKDSTMWSGPILETTNRSGFKALPGGYRFPTTNGFYGILRYGFWWSTTNYKTSSTAWVRYISADYNYIFRYNYHVKVGCSVRCIKD
jgi:uncharacterized protein (TIGR02145 family)